MYASSFLSQMKKEKTWEYDGLIWEFFRGGSLGYETRVFIRWRKERTLAAKMPKEYGRKVGDSTDVVEIFLSTFCSDQNKKNLKGEKNNCEIPCFCFYTLKSSSQLFYGQPYRHQGSGYLEQQSTYLLEFMCMNSQLTYSVLFG